jgi:beta-lactam-binding protein with PASTA domain
MKDITMITFRDAPPTLSIPNVVRLTARAARETLECAGLHAVFVAAGQAQLDVPDDAVVLVQVPSMGQLTHAGAGVALYLS